MEKKCTESDSKSNTILKKVISDVEGLLGQSIYSESVEGLQDKIRILVEEWSEISEHEVCTFLGCTCSSVNMYQSNSPIDMI